MSEKGKVIFKINKEGKASFEMSGFPGETCLDAKENIEPILAQIGASEINTNATEEMHIHASKPTEAFNNV